MQNNILQIDQNTMQFDNKFRAECNKVLPEWEARMHQVLFTTKLPNDHIPRALDILRKMGFALHALSAEKTGAGLFSVRLQYLPLGGLSAQTFVDRLARFDGLEVCMQPLPSNVIPQMAALCGTAQPNFSTRQAERLS